LDISRGTVVAFVIVAFVVVDAYWHASIERAYINAAVPLWEQHYHNSDNNNNNNNNNKIYTRQSTLSSNEKENIKIVAVLPNDEIKAPMSSSDMRTSSSLICTPLSPSVRMPMHMTATATQHRRDYSIVILVVSLNASAAVVVAVVLTMSFFAL
jgi:hypothetical protein